MVSDPDSVISIVGGGLVILFLLLLFWGLLIAPRRRMRAVTQHLEGKGWQPLDLSWETALRPIELLLGETAEGDAGPEVTVERAARRSPVLRAFRDPASGFFVALVSRRAKSSRLPASQISSSSGVTVGGHELWIGESRSRPEVAPATVYHYVQDFLSGIARIMGQPGVDLNEVLGNVVDRDSPETEKVQDILARWRDEAKKSQLWIRVGPEALVLVVSLEGGGKRLDSLLALAREVSTALS